MTIKRWAAIATLVVTTVGGTYSALEWFVSYKTKEIITQADASHRSLQAQIFLANKEIIDVKIEQLRSHPEGVDEVELEVLLRQRQLYDEAIQKLAQE